MFFLQTGSLLLQNFDASLKTRIQWYNKNTIMRPTCKVEETRWILKPELKRVFKTTTKSKTEKYVLPEALVLSLLMTEKNSRTERPQSGKVTPAAPDLSMFWFHNFWLQFFGFPSTAKSQSSTVTWGLIPAKEKHPKGMAKWELTVHHWPPSKSNICIRWLHVCSISFFRNNLGMVLYWWSSKLSSLVKCLSALSI